MRGPPPNKTSRSTCLIRQVSVDKGGQKVTGPVVTLVHGERARPPRSVITDDEHRRITDARFGIRSLSGATLTEYHQTNLSTSILMSKAPRSSAY